MIEPKGANDPYVTQSMLNASLELWSKKIVAEISEVISDWIMRIDERFNQVDSRLNTIEKREENRWIEINNKLNDRSNSKV